MTTGAATEIANAEQPAAPDGISGQIDRDRWYYRGIILPAARSLSWYHRARVSGAEPPKGPCIYVAHHGAGYLTMDLVVAVYQLAWRAWHERRGPAIPLWIAASQGNAVERAIPGLARVKQAAGLVDASEATCRAVLERGDQLLLTPGGQREMWPDARDYQLRWAGRFGFVRLALLTGAPIVPLAVVGGYEAYPGVRIGKLSFWSPIPLPARIDIALGDPFTPPAMPDRARAPEVVEPIQRQIWQAAQSLYDDLLARRGR